MKYVLLSDVHFSSSQTRSRKENMLSVGVSKLFNIFNQGLPVLQAGDLFDKPRDFEALFEMTEILRKFKQEFYFVAGQHDSYFRTGKVSSAYFLSRFGYGHLLYNNQKYKRCGLDKIYGSGWGEEIPIVKKNDQGKNILICHAPISDAPLWPGHHFTKAEDFLSKHNSFDLILCGDVHKYFVREQEGRYCINTGPLIRRSIIEKKHAPRFIVYDSTKNTIEEKKIKHDNKHWDRQQAEQDNKIKKIAEEFIDMIRNDNILEIDAVFILEKILLKNKHKIEEGVIKIIEEIKGAK
jgi:predicted phosphodiesterase